MFLFLFLVTFSNDLLIPVPIVNIKVKEEPAIPAGVPTTEAYEAILNYTYSYTFVSSMTFKLFILKYSFNNLIVLFKVIRRK